MAGGEFCGNALRALGYILLNGKKGKIEVNCSGMLNVQPVNVDSYYSEIEILTSNNPHLIKRLSKNESIIQIESSKFLVATMRR